MNRCVVVFLLLLSIHTGCLAQNDHLKFKHYQPYTWMVGLGMSMIDNDGRPDVHILDFEKKILFQPFPTHFFVDRYFDFGLSFEGSLSFNTFSSNFLDNQLYPKRSLLAFDVAARYSFYDMIDGSDWFDPYVGIGLGLSHINMNTNAAHFYTVPTANILAGMNMWIGNFGTPGDFGIRVQANFKFGMLKHYRISDVSYRHYTLSVVYRFDLGEKKDDSFRKPKYKWVHDSPKEEKTKKQKKSE